jgi:hypothetical protein
VISNGGKITARERAQAPGNDDGTAARGSAPRLIHAGGSR